MPQASYDVNPYVPRVPGPRNPEEATTQDAKGLSYRTCICILIVVSLVCVTTVTIAWIVRPVEKSDDALRSSNEPPKSSQLKNRMMPWSYDDSITTASPEPTIVITSETSNAATRVPTSDATTDLPKSTLPSTSVNALNDTTTTPRNIVQHQSSTILPETTNTTMSGDTVRESRVNTEVSENSSTNNTSTTPSGKRDAPIEDNGTKSSSKFETVITSEMGNAASTVLRGDESTDLPESTVPSTSVNTLNVTTTTPRNIVQHLSSTILPETTNTTMSGDTVRESSMNTEVSENSSTNNTSTTPSGKRDAPIEDNGTKSSSKFETVITSEMGNAASTVLRGDESTDLPESTVPSTSVNTLNVTTTTPRNIVQHLTSTILPETTNTTMSGDTVRESRMNTEVSENSSTNNTSTTPSGERDAPIEDNGAKSSSKSETVITSEMGNAASPVPTGDESTDLPESALPSISVNALNVTTTTPKNIVQHQSSTTLPETTNTTMSGDTVRESRVNTEVSENSSTNNTSTTPSGERDAPIEDNGAKSSSKSETVITSEMGNAASPVPTGDESTDLPESALPSISVNALNVTTTTPKNIVQHQSSTTLPETTNTTMSGDTVRESRVNTEVSENSSTNNTSTTPSGERDAPIEDNGAKSSSKSETVITSEMGNAASPVPTGDESTDLPESALPSISVNALNVTTTTPKNIVQHQSSTTLPETTNTTMSGDTVRESRVNTEVSENSSTNNTSTTPSGERDAPIEDNGAKSSSKSETVITSEMGNAASPVPTGDESTDLPGSTLPSASVNTDKSDALTPSTELIQPTTPEYTKTNPLPEDDAPSSIVAPTEITTHMNSSSDPIGNFEEFADSSIGKKSEKQDPEIEINQRILDEAERQAHSTASRRFMNYYNSCMDYGNFTEAERLKILLDSDVDIRSFLPNFARKSPKNYANVTSELLLRDSPLIVDVNLDTSTFVKDDAIFTVRPRLFETVLYARKDECNVTAIDTYAECKKKDILTSIAKFNETFSNWDIEVIYHDTRELLDEYFDNIYPVKETEIIHSMSSEYQSKTVVEWETDINASCLNLTKILSILTGRPATEMGALNILISDKTQSVLKTLCKMHKQPRSYRKLDNFFLGLYIADMYKKFVERPENTKEYCIRISTNLLRPEASILYMSSFSTEEHQEKNHTVSRITEKLKDTLSLKIQKKTEPKLYEELGNFLFVAPDPSLIEELKSVIDSSDTSITANASDFYANTINISKRNRKAMYNELKPNPDYTSAIWTYFAVPYQTSIVGIYGMKTIVVPYGALEWALPTYNTSDHFALGTVGNLIAREIAHQILERITLKTAMNTEKVDWNEQRDCYLKNQSIDQISNMPKKEKISYAMGLQLTKEAMERLNMNKSESISNQQQFLSDYIQMYCTKKNPSMPPWVSYYMSEKLPEQSCAAAEHSVKKYASDAWHGEDRSDADKSDTCDIFPNISERPLLHSSAAK